MRFAFTDEQNMFRDALRDMLARECTAGHVRAAWDSQDGCVPGLWRKLAELGVAGLTVPEDHGGMGLDALDLVLLLEESGCAAVPEPLVETTAVAAPLLRDLAMARPDSAEHAEHAVRAEMAARWLAPIAAGDAIIAICLDGMSFIADLHRADLLLIARDGELHALAPGAVHARPQRSVDHSRRIAAIDDWQPTRQTLLAPADQARPLLAAAFNRGALAVSAQLVGIARRLIDITVEYVKTRQQFGRPIGSFQAVKHHLANAQVALSFSRPVLYRAAYSLARRRDIDSPDIDADIDIDTHVSMARSYAADAAHLAGRVALQCHGAMGYAFEYDLHLWMKRAWALSAQFGDARWHRQRIGNAILSAPGAGDANPGSYATDFDK